MARTNYLRPFMEDVGKLAKAGINAITGAKPEPEPDAGVQLMGNPSKLQKRSTEGSPAFSKSELKQGYRKVK